MGRSRLTDEVMIDRVKSIMGVLNDGAWHSTNELMCETDLTCGQLKSAIKFNRRYFLKCPEKCANKYIISGKHGYKLTTTDEDYIAMYKSLYAWGKSVLITISPMGKWLQSQGYDMREIREQAMNDGIKDTIDNEGADNWHE